MNDLLPGTSQHKTLKIAAANGFVVIGMNKTDSGEERVLPHVVSILKRDGLLVPSANDYLRRESFSLSCVGAEKLSRLDRASAESA